MKNLKLMNNVAPQTTSTAKEIPVISRALSIVNTTPEYWGKRIAVIPIDLLEVDYTYQRILTHHVNEIAKDFRKEKCDPLIVSYRDDKFYIIDGQHRYFAAIQNGIDSLLCVIHKDLTLSEECRFFVEMNTSRKPLKPIDTFKANIACGNRSIPDVAIDMDIKSICDKYDIEITEDNRMSKGKRLRSLTHIRRCMKTPYGKQLINFLFKIITESNWCDDGNAYSDKILYGLTNYIGENMTSEMEVKIRKFMDTLTPEYVITYSNQRFPSMDRYARISASFRELI